MIDCIFLHKEKDDFEGMCECEEQDVMRYDYPSESYCRKCHKRVEYDKERAEED